MVLTAQARCIDETRLRALGGSRWMECLFGWGEALRPGQLRGAHLSFRVTGDTSYPLQRSGTETAGSASPRSGLASRVLLR